MSDSFAAIEFETLVLMRQLAPTRRHEDGRPHLERSAYTLLTRLSRQGPMSIGQLSEAFGLDTSTLNRQTAAMMRQGLVERIPDPDGGLARKFVPSAAGLAQLEAERQLNVSGVRRVLEAWNAEDVAHLAELLRRFNLDIEARDGRPWPRPAD
ncbi:MarR family transcriptional regulator [Nocardioides sp. AE5]|uniref:MarR family winged helix-turn-helix transcriptional regulator n=1 Tax=Nocardioides sp. AE5 TaxID=2962573 RepID=UPI002882A481|nr:MarR family transcriptional regulator [Nocardioides sp. AE5]MDT0201641.1 MarR family transcriptional regulator [Nocardioides sp. AE5]